jgi:hypothetical protein|tara:strand:- start:1269 stop:1418 length:150 start_codon:yes stop_codon:yes gene_type:complete
MPPRPFLISSISPTVPKEVTFASDFVLRALPNKIQSKPFYKPQSIKTSE